MKEKTMIVEKQSHRRIGLAVFLAVGLMTALAATIAVAARGRATALNGLDFSDNWEDVLGI